MTVRIATYNLFEGAGGSYNRLVEFVRSQQLDVVCFQEVNGWQDNDLARLKDFTDKILFAAYAYGNSNSEFKLATVSKHAILDRILHAEAFWHAALETRLRLGNRDISIINLHLDPWKEESREREIARLLAMINPGRPTIITGDFNSLSRQDNYPPDLLNSLRAKGISKFGMQALEFSVIDRLLQAGFVDVAIAAGNPQPTVPSAFNNDQDHEVPVRVDYMFVSPDLAQFVQKVECVKNDLTDAISDHYPLVVTIGLEDTSVGPPPAQSIPRPAQPQPAPELPAPAAQPSSVPAPAPEAPLPRPIPWTPPDEPSAPAAQEPPAPPPPKDGEVIMWSHDTENDGQ